MRRRIIDFCNGAPFALIALAGFVLFGGFAAALVVVGLVLATLDAPFVMLGVLVAVLVATPFVVGLVRDIKADR